MSEPNDHRQIADAGGVLVLDFRFTTAASWLANVKSTPLAGE
jgi:hypothetical protein